MFATVEGMVVSTTDNVYKEKKQKTIDLLQKSEGKKSVIASVRVPDDGRLIPPMGEQAIFFGLIYTFGNTMLLTVD